MASSAVSTGARADNDDDLDLAGILADLGLDEDFLDSRSQGSETHAADSAVQTETEEEKAEKVRLRVEETKAKRAEITRRHAQWEADIEGRITQNKKALRQALVTMRKTATTELKENQEIRKEIEDLVEDAEKYLRGSEKYMATLKKESRSSDEKKIIWDRVVEKVDKKFAERLSQTETLVNGWYASLLTQEVAEVSNLSYAAAFFMCNFLRLQPPPRSAASRMK